MKRLMSKLARSARESFRVRRLMRLAEWVDVDVNDPGLVQQVTDIMASGGQIQIQYQGEWKLISPYGWNSSKEGNVLLMCYKDTGEVRSYRLDRIEAVQIDSSQVTDNSMDDSLDSLDTGLDDSNTTEEFDVPEENNEQNELEPQNELPFDDAMNILEVSEPELNQDQPENVNPVEQNDESSSEENPLEEQVEEIK